MPAFIKERLICAVAALLGLFPNALLSQGVELIPHDGSVSVFGNLIEVTEENYLVETDLGAWSIARSTVTCSGDGCPGQEGPFSIRIAAPEEHATSLLPGLIAGFAEDLGAEFEISSQDEKKIIFGLTSSSGERIGDVTTLLRNGDDLFLSMIEEGVSFVIANDRPSLNVANRISDAGLGDIMSQQQERVISIIALAVVVHPENSLSDVKIADIRQIIDGDISDWSELGGVPGPINLYLFGEGGSTSPYLELVGLPGYPEISERISIMPTMGRLSQAVATDPRGIGIVNYTNTRNFTGMTILGGCGMTFSADDFSIKMGNYPLQHRVTLYNIAELDESEQQFMDLLDTTNLDRLVARAGYVDLSIKEDTEEMTARRVEEALHAPNDDMISGPFVQNAVIDMLETDRLSTIFRFASGVSSLDIKALHDLDRLATYLQSNPKERVLVVGYADSWGQFSSNTALAQSRAAIVAEELRARMPARMRGSLLDIQTRAMSELGPVACNDDSEGRAVNRRVEIWVK